MAKIVVDGGPMSTPQDKLDNPEYWRFRAQEVRTIAEDMRAGEPKEIMLRIAEDYERITVHAEKRTLHRV